MAPTRDTKPIFRVFVRADGDQNGALCHQEWRQFIRDVGGEGALSDSEILELYTQVAGSAGLVHYEQFRDWVLQEEVDLTRIEKRLGREQAGKQSSQPGKWREVAANGELSLRAPEEDPHVIVSGEDGAHHKYRKTPAHPMAPSGVRFPSETGPEADGKQYPRTPAPQTQGDGHVHIQDDHPDVDHKHYPKTPAAKGQRASEVTFGDVEVRPGPPHALSLPLAVGGDDSGGEDRDEPQQPTASLGKFPKTPVAQRSGVNFCTEDEEHTSKQYPRTPAHTRKAPDDIDDEAESAFHTDREVTLDAQSPDVHTLGSYPKTPVAGGAAGFGAIKDELDAEEAALAAEQGEEMDTAATDAQ